MPKKLKGSAVAVVLIVAAVAVVGVGIYHLIKYGKFGSGGDGDSVLPANAQVTEVSEETTVTLEVIEYTEVIVSANEYIYAGKTYSDAEELAAAIDTEAYVRITDDRASVNAYNALTKALSGKNIRYIEDSEGE